MNFFIVSRWQLEVDFNDKFLNNFVEEIFKEILKVQILKILN